MQLYIRIQRLLKGNDCYFNRQKISSMFWSPIDIYYNWRDVFLGAILYYKSIFDLKGILQSWRWFSCCNFNINVQLTTMPGLINCRWKVMDHNHCWHQRDCCKVMICTLNNLVTGHKYFFPCVTADMGQPGSPHFIFVVCAYKCCEISVPKGEFSCTPVQGGTIIIVLTEFMHCSLLHHALRF